MGRPRNTAVLALTGTALIGMALTGCGGQSIPYSLPLVSVAPSAAPSLDLSQFGDVSGYCAAVPRAQRYVEALASGTVGTFDDADLRAAFGAVIVGAPTIIKDDWRRIEQFEVWAQDAYAKVGLSRAELTRAQASGGSFLPAAKRRTLKRLGRAVIARVLSPALSDSANKAVGATHDLCGIDLVPLPPS